MTQLANNSNFCKPFREFIKKENGTYFVRLGPKTYLVKTDKKIEGFYRWSTIQVIDPKFTEPRAIREKELELEWLRPNLKAVINYQIKIEDSNRIKTMELEARLRNKRKYPMSWWGK